MQLHLLLNVLVLASVFTSWRGNVVSCTYVHVLSSVHPFFDLSFVTVLNTLHSCYPVPCIGRQIECEDLCLHWMEGCVFLYLLQWDLWRVPSIILIDCGKEPWIRPGWTLRFESLAKSLTLSFLISKTAIVVPFSACFTNSIRLKWASIQKSDLWTVKCSVNIVY